MKPFQAQCVYAGSDGGYFEIAFQEAKDQADDRPYLDIQWDPAETDKEAWYVEATDPEGEWGYGYYVIQSAELAPSHFRVRWGPDVGESAEVTFEVDASAYTELARVAQAMFPHAKITYDPEP